METAYIFVLILFKRKASLQGNLIDKYLRCTEQSTYFSSFCAVLCHSAKHTHFPWWIDWECRNLWVVILCDLLTCFLNYPPINIWSTFHLLLSVQSPKFENWNICVGKITTILDAWNNSEIILVVKLASITLKINYSQDTEKILMQTATVIPPPKCP